MRIKAAGLSKTAVTFSYLSINTALRLWNHTALDDDGRARHGNV